mmetsp:Transcript_74440/g.174714  ORF Transcript_74440/g.174714 Transcript_74440/m.174714 type:complete len:126 (-) Transcript_74440:27-404(-)
MAAGNVLSSCSTYAAGRDPTASPDPDEVDDTPATAHLTAISSSDRQVLRANHGGALAVVATVVPFIVGASHNGTVSVWDSISGHLVHAVHEPQSSLFSVAVDDGIVLAGGTSGDIFLWRDPSSQG